jgi:hypothetical protein
MRRERDAAVVWHVVGRGRLTKVDCVAFEACLHQRVHDLGERHAVVFSTVQARFGELRQLSVHGRDAEPRDGLFQDAL